MHQVWKTFVGFRVCKLNRKPKLRSAPSSFAPASLDSCSRLRLGAELPS
jgi:hypothetical protein